MEEPPKTLRERWEAGLVYAGFNKKCKRATRENRTYFLQNVLQHGMLLYLRYPFMAPAFAQNLKPVTIVSYSLKGLSQNEKMRVIYRLFGREKKGEGLMGVVGEGGGRKLGDGCFMIPTERLDVVINVLKRHKVTFDVLRAYLPSLI